MSVKHPGQFAYLRKFAILACTALLVGCATGAHTVATDVQIVEKPVPVPCEFKWPDKPIAYVALVQLTGDDKKDLVLIERAMEAELEARIAYEKLLEAAALACSKARPPD